MFRAALIAGSLAISGLLLPGAASAGDESGDSAAGAKPHLSAPDAAAFGKQIEQDLAAKGARVAIVFRTSRPHDKLPPGIAYTHGAFWVHSDITTNDGRTLQGYAVYNLYHGDGKTLPVSRSYLKQDFPLNFAIVSAEDDVGVIIPTPEMQRRLKALIGSPDYEHLHITDYSLVSNPLDAKYQNCVEFLLDVVASAAWETESYPQIKANLGKWFTPTTVKAGFLQRTLGPMADARLRTDDHPGPIRTATYESLSAFMLERGLASEAYVIKRNIP
ncbi:DUF2145 domain-containing protein [Asticcacaulis sp. AND118]|uniref:DUF2145 domain-containing protein n=1 Tax=Asticcacaulis sp. AND118 TaxID=2840468 RepID=UPI001CFF9AA0|nr:DUF2145 domain-containing protein [Asticcacaulis sp. AND118]UDF02892.1 DUF2145 domain-containing protein [Asticcacaulis sp. AND118]